MAERTVPVYLLTGFLGSGKTTLLRRLIDDANGRGWKPAVLMNEAGDVNLDGMLVDAEVPMAEMLGGCICCTVRADLGVELMSLVKEHDPDVIWIESTGVAEPMEIIDGVTEASFYGRIELKGVVTVVDARHLLDRMRIGTGKTYRLMQDQIRAASLIVLNKTDLVAPAERDELAERLADWNGGAAIVQTVGAEIDPELIYGIREGFPAQSTSQEHRHDHHEHHHEHQHEHHHGHHHVRAMTRYLKGPVDSHAFEAFVGHLPEGVYRAKGIVSFRDTANRYLFQYAYRQSDFLPIRPQKTVHDVLVFIGEDFSESDLDAELDKLTSEDRN